jgi:diguanylate cyclase (GGDEF)-like protein
MARSPDPPLDSRGNVVPLRAGEVPDPLDEAAADHVAEDASRPDVLDLRAEERDRAADARDAAAASRADLELQVDGHELELLRLFAARDRAAAALDRHEAALDRHRAAAYLQRTYRDGLTGALHREAGREELAQEIARAHRSGDPLVVAFLDVVHLKRTNDEKGHAAGDAVLSAVGAALAKGLRSYDVVVRYGGDEFICALPDTDLLDAGRRMRDVARLLSAASPGAEISVGLAKLAVDESLDEVIGRADRALYAGRSRLAGSTVTTAAPGAPD